MLKALFAGWIALLPLISWNGRFEGPKVLWFLVGGTGVIAYWLFRILRQKKYFDFLKSDLFYFLWLVTLLISSVFGVHFNLSIVGGSYRHQGVIFFFLLWLVGKTFLILKGSDKKLVIKFIGLAVLMESAIVIFQYIFGKVYFDKPLGTIGEANAVAGFLVLGSYFIFQIFPKIILIFPTIPLFMEQSRSGILTGLVMSGAFMDKLKPKSKIVIWSLTILTASILVMLLTSQKTNSPFENRYTVWKLGITSVMKKPVLGYGAESGEVVYNEAFKNYGLPLYNLMVDRAHNLYIDVAMWSGGIGLIMFIAWLINRFKSLTGFPQKYAYLAFLVYAFFQPLSIVHWILFFLII